MTRNLLSKVLASSGIALALLATLAVAANSGAREEAWKLTRPAPRALFDPAKLDGAEKLDCARCHADVVEEWSQTAHALAWVDKQYQEQLADKKKPESCHGCHIPKPIFAARGDGAGEISGKPPARDDLREHGVSCVSCHLGAGGAMLGPRGAATAAHPTKLSSAFVGAGSNELCSGCHKTNIGPVVGLAKDFEQSKQAERGRSCVGCHCEALEMRFTKDGEDGKTSAGESVAPVRRGRSHALQTPRDPTFLRRAFALALRVEGAKSTIVVRNTAGHRVPGLIGRTIKLHAEVLDEAGKVQVEQTLIIDASSYLPVDGELSITLPVAAARVHVVGTHDEPRADGPVDFLDEMLTP